MSLEEDITGEEQFSHYIVWSEDKKVITRDSEVPGYRPYDIVLDRPALSGELSRRGKTEKNRRGGAKYRIVYEDWVYSGEKLWEVNNNIKLISSEYGITGTFLISSVELIKDETGRKATLVLEKREKYA